MATPTTFSDYGRSSAALQTNELMVGKCANGIREFLFHSIRSSGTRRFSPSGRWRERRLALIRFAHSPPSIQFFPLRVNSNIRHAASLMFSWRSVFELRH
jgi:hypothetical protein